MGVVFGLNRLNGIDHRLQAMGDLPPTIHGACAFFATGEQGGSWSRFCRQCQPASKRITWEDQSAGTAICS